MRRSWSCNLKPLATSDLDGGNHLTRRKTKARTKAKTQLKKKLSRREGSLAYANGIDCARGSQKPEKQKQFIA
jgi:hypothetical protein